MNGGTTRRAVWALLPVLVVSLAVLVAPASGSRSATILWQGKTPEDGTALVAGQGREFLIELEAAGGLGSSVQIRVNQLPAGARLVKVSDSPAKAVFRWTPRRTQLGEWRFVFRALDGGDASPRIAIRVHVGQRASRTFKLSSTTARSRNAVLLRNVVARARPSENSRAVGRLRTVTPEHVPHVLYLASGHIGRDGRYWLRVPLPVLPNGTMGWIPREAVGSFVEVDTHLVVDRSSFRATLYKGGRVVFRSIVGVGEPHWPTPAGSFYIRERLTGFTDPIYGSLAFGTNARSAVLTDWPGGGFIGIHGTNQPGILPGRVSHGCVRIRNPDIQRLDRLIRVGTPVTIR
jgi:L,D-transpeptidase catalytic domain